MAAETAAFHRSTPGAISGRGYPESNKLAVNALRTREAIFDMAGVRRCRDGEETR
jgi:hypothetical protein